MCSCSRHASCGSLARAGASDVTRRAPHPWLVRGSRGRRRRVSRRAECIDRIGTPTSTVWMPRARRREAARSLTRMTPRCSRRTPGDGTAARRIGVPGGGAVGVGGVALVCVDLQDRPPPGHRQVHGVVPLRIVRVHGMADVAGDVQRRGERAGPVSSAVAPSASPMAAQHVFVEGACGAGARRAADFFVVERGEHRDRPRRCVRHLYRASAPHVSTAGCRGERTRTGHHRRRTRAGPACRP